MTTILTKALRAKLIENGQAQRAAIRHGSDDPQPIDPYPVVRLFTPDAGATWLLTELDPEDDDLAFGLWRALHNPNYVDPSVMWMPAIRSPRTSTTRTGSLHITTALARWRASSASGPTRP